MTATPQNLVLAVYPFSKGIAFVLFEGLATPFDWGVKEIKGQQKNAKSIDAVNRIIDRYQPEVLVIEDASVAGSRRDKRIRELYHMLAHMARAESIDLYRYTKKEVAACFAMAGARTKYDIARAIATQIPAFSHRLPRYRKPWMSEDPRQSLFDAAALAVTFYENHVAPWDSIGDVDG